MMEYLVDNFEIFANTYIRVLIELYLLLVAVLLACWIKLFMRKENAAFISAGIYYVLGFVNNHIGSNKEFDRLLAVGILVVGILTAWFFDCKRNLIQKIFLFIVFRLISWLSIELFCEIGFWERDFVFKFDWYKNSMKAVVLEFCIWNLMQYALALLLLYVVIRALHKVYRFKSDELTWQELVILLAPAWTLLLVKPIMSSYFRLWMDGIKNGSISQNIQANPYRVLFCAFAYVSIVTVIVLYQKLKEKQEEIFIKNSVEKQISDISGHMEHIEKIYEEMRGIRHDFGNHLTVIERLAENSAMEELVSYIEEFGESFERLQPRVKTGNAVTDVILSEVAEQCEKKNIRFENSFIYPDDLYINPFDMSVILTNALKNALEATRMVSESVIIIKSVKKESVFIINIKNTINRMQIINDEGLPETTKQESGHGYGIKNIRSIAYKYKGDIEIRQEELDGKLFFILNVMLIGN